MIIIIIGHSSTVGKTKGINRILDMKPTNALIEDYPLLIMDLISIQKALDRIIHLKLSNTKAE